MSASIITQYCSRCKRSLRLSEFNKGARILKTSQRCQDRGRALRAHKRSNTITAGETTNLGYFNDEFVHDNIPNVITSYCAECRQNKPAEKFNHAHRQAPYKSCIECRGRSKIRRHPFPAQSTTSMNKTNLDIYM